jgi:alanyl-tRNA synthetase
MDVDKNELRRQFAKDWETHYKLKCLMERGFSRRKCKACGRMFWSLEERERCGDSSCIGYQFIGSTPVKRKLDYMETWKTIEKYFTSHGHGYVKPYPTVARWRDDLYFTIASINDFQPYVVNGELDPPHNPLIVPQACIRFPDISNVGVSGRHYTNFVMVGQHAFNTKKTGLFYWKDEALEHDINYLTALGIPEKELIFQEDVWAGGGNYGPCIEYFVRGLELGNCVFMQYETTPTGNRELKTKVIDMGAGLERLAWITSGDLTSYETVFGPVIAEMKKEAGVSVPKELFERYAKLAGSLNEDEVADMEKEKERIAALLGIGKKELFDTVLPLQALYASADHLKTSLFSITDGMLPSNSGGGYNIRMLLRRVFGFGERFGYSLDYAKIVEAHARHVAYMYPHLKDGVPTVIDVMAEEKRRYDATKEKARLTVISIVKKAKAPKQGVPSKERADGAGSITAAELSTLYRSNGISPEYVVDIAKENGIEVQVPGNFYAVVREGEGDSEGKRGEQGVRLLAADVVDFPRTTELYYTKERMFRAKILGVLNAKYVVLDQTAFYPEGGGQVADTGALEASGSVHKVINTQKSAGVVLHEVENAARLKKGQEVSGIVDIARRTAIARHHTSAHLVNAACREVLGQHIWQAGSHKDDEKGHLDVTHYRRITPAELRKIELKVNEYIMRDMPVVTNVLPRNEAEKKFGFRLYQGGAVPGKELRVVSVGDIDHEACGGTHQMLSSTGQIGAFKIVKREPVQDGVERIVYKAGAAAISHMQEKEELLRSASDVLGVSDSELVQTVERFFREWKEQRKALEKMGAQMVGFEAKEIIAHGPGKPQVRTLELDAAMLRQLGQMIAESDDSAACLMNKEGNIICAAGKNSKFSAKALLAEAIKQLGGTGGGSDRIAQGKVARAGHVNF